jgi:tetratricopeptide (TPR) repeat protein
MESETTRHDEEDAPLSGGEAAAIALALARSGKFSGTDEAATTFLHRQSQLVSLQMENLHEQRLLQIRNLKRRELSDRLRLTLQILAVAAGTAIAAVLIAMVVDASRSNALVIQPISAPADLQGRGVTPAVLSAQLLDKLRAMQSRTDSARGGSTYTGANSDDIKLEIPETGVSLGELLRVLRERLGHDVHVTAETFHQNGKLVLTVRVGDFAGHSFSGADADLDGLMQQAAEAVFAQTQPYRYSVFLSQNGRTEAAMQVLQRASERGPRSERAWAYVGLGGQLGALSRMREAEAATRRGLRLDPDLAAGWNMLTSVALALGHDEDALAAARETWRTLGRWDNGGVTAKAKAQNLITARATIAELTGDFRRGRAIRASASELEGYQFIGAGHSVEAAIDALLGHQATRAPAVALSEDDLETPVYRARLLAAQGWTSGEWAAAVSGMEQIQTAAAAGPQAADRAMLWPVEVWPWQAYGYARLGRLAEAQALIGRTPLDCYLCLRMRGEIAALSNDRHGVDLWFARAVRTAPTLPFAYAEWARAVERWGDEQRAAGLYRQARARGPAWPDPLVWWGQSLLSQGKPGAALARFEGAASLAPGWAAARDGLKVAEARPSSGR